MLGYTNDMRDAAYAAVKSVIERKEDAADRERLFLVARELADAALDAAHGVVLEEQKKAALATRAAQMNAQVRR